MKIVQIILITLTAFAGCKKSGNALAVKTDTVKIMTGGTINYLALGDSYTIGESVPQDQSYPYQLAELLNKQSFFVQPPTIIATTGWTTDELINAIAASPIHGKTYDFVTLLIGVNDQFRGLSMDNYKLKFTQVLNTAITFAKGDTSRVFVLSIPDWGVTPFGKGRENEVGPEIDAFNAANQQISKAAGVHYLNITDISRVAATDLSLIAADGLHPSGKMYTLWMQRLAPLVLAGLEK